MSADPAQPPVAPPPADPDRAPTLEDVAAMTAAAQQAMQGITDSSQAIQAAIDGMKAEAANRSLTVPEEVISQISTAAAAATVGELRKIGAIRDDTDPPADPAAPPAPADPANPPAPPADPAPERRKSPAERFLGL